MSAPRSFGQPDAGVSYTDTSCLCICHFTGAPCDDAVCARSSGSSAVISPLVSQPAAPARASSDRTPRTIATPLGPTTRFAIR